MDGERVPEPPWYEENWWVFLVALLVVVGAILAFFAFRNQGERAATVTETETVVVTETETVVETVEQEPEGVELPNLEGVEHHDAVEQLLDAGLVPNTFPVESQAERGTVVGQQPAPGEQVGAGSVVRLDVSLGTGEREQLEVPELAGMRVAGALEECNRAGFTCALVSDAGAQTRVARQQPQAGEQAPELSQIRLAP